MPSKKDKPLFDEHGHWVEERGRIKGAIRKSFRLSPQMRETLLDARVELPPALKKDGTPGKRPQVRYRCASCGELFQQKYVQVDHIETVVPLHKSESSMEFKDWIYTIARGIFSSKENLQVLCSTPMKHNNGEPSCHKVKTDAENYTRRQLAKITEEINNDNLQVYIDKFMAEFHEQRREKEEKRKNKATKPSGSRNAKSTNGRRGSGRTTNKKEK